MCCLPFAYPDEQIFGTKLHGWKELLHDTCRRDAHRKTFSIAILPTAAPVTSNSFHASTAGAAVLPLSR